MAEEKKAEDKKKNERVPTAKKRHLQSVRKNKANTAFISSVKTAVKAFQDSLAKGDKQASMKKLDAVYSLMDKAVKTGIFKSNKAARIKSRLAIKTL